MSFEDIKNSLMNGELKLYEVEERLSESHSDMNPETRASKAAELRREFISYRTGVDIPVIGRSYVDTSDSKGRPATELVIGGAVTPLSIAGPLNINGEFADGEFYIPLATNEAALVASANKGISVVNKSSGITTQVKYDHMTRAPLLLAPDIKTARKLAQDVGSDSELFHKMKSYIEGKSNVTRLLKIEPFTNGREVHLRFYYQTGDSMGMNSATIYTGDALKFLNGMYRDCKLISLSGNMCTDKKTTAINNILGRGKGIETEVLIPADLIRKMYGVRPEDIERLNYVKNYKGSALAGAAGGFNANASNIIAAIFTATGQDMGQVPESSSAFTNAAAEKNGLYFGVTLPSLEVGTVGGGTGYGTSRECLRILGCYGAGKNPGDNANKLAEIIGAAVTAQELNLLGTLARGTELAESHDKRRRVYVPGNYGDKLESVYLDGMKIEGLDADGKKPRYGLRIVNEYMRMIFDLMGAPSGLGGGPQEEKAILDYQKRNKERWERIEELSEARKALGTN